ncbi:IS110 family transposase [Evansella sp. AB-P1]|uniref:IS110 family transposase n=1 Tax=Evansella sp. AB-P1 TaxID=3037653 RepID=UPI00241C82D8|nr:IS110 family transposase [Evansella sp. AB-P1]MDG5790196.1 IS110 family transposase [Evansella sp. AB-P1]
MAHNLLNHIQGKNGSRWAQFIRETGSENLLLVAIDAAKYTHKAILTTFYGDILVKPFEFDASQTGLELVKTQIHSVKEEYGLTEVIVGIETTGHYYEDLVRKCLKAGYRVRVVNAATTDQERKALMNWSKTDNIDLMAIIQSLINGRGTSSELSSGNIGVLQKLTRARREIVDERTSTQNLIRMHMDHVFREFQGKSVWENGKRKHVQPFSKLFGKAPCYIMKYYPHPSDIMGLGEDGLRKLSIQENLKLRDSTIKCLIDFAENSISQPKQEVQADIYLLAQKLDRLELLDEQIKQLEKKIEDLFLETPGAIILSVPGIGLVTGAEFFAEMGDLSDFDHAGQLIKLAGTNPIVKQSGGHRPSYYGISKQGRRTFRNIVYQVGKSLSVNNPEMRERYLALKDKGKHTRQAYVAIGNRMIRLAFSMIRHQSLYRSNHENYALVNVLSNKLRSANVTRFYKKFVPIDSSKSA